MAVLTCQNRCSTRCAQGIRAEGIGESYTLVGKSIDVRCVIDLASVRRNGVGSVIVLHDVEDIWAGAHV